VLAGGLIVGVVAGPGEPGHAASKPSYCAASLAVDHYLGHRADRVHALLAQVQAVAPPAVAGLVRTMRASPPRSARYQRAKGVWSRYNTDTCCTCIGGSSAPHVLLQPVR